MSKTIYGLVNMCICYGNNTWYILLNGEALLKGEININKLMTSLKNEDNFMAKIRIECCDGFTEVSHKGSSLFTKSQIKEYINGFKN
jgi:hypothetical protein